MAISKPVVFFFVIFILSFYCMVKAKDQIPENTRLLRVSAVFCCISIIGMVLFYLGLG